MRTVLGLDVGGANLKAAHSGGAAISRAFPLYRRPGDLAGELRRLLAALPGHDRLAVTMTGELCDCFATKAEGVAAILAAVEQVAAAPVRVWTTAGTFVDLATARAQPTAVAAANWLALAHLAGRLAETEALLIDAGSTTTDLVYLERGTPRPRGRTDPARLKMGELVYTGLRRTPVCAILGMEVAAEFFATMLDAYVALGLSPEQPEDTDTADGRPVTCRHAQARLARLRCADVDELPAEEIVNLAWRAVVRQTAHVCGAVHRVLRDRPAPRQVIVSGSGEVLARHVCARHPRLNALPVMSLAERLGAARSEAAAAYAVAVLAAGERE